MSLADDQSLTSQDVEHLRVLKICHYVMAGINAAAAVIQFLMIAVFGIIALTAASQSRRNVAAPLAAFGIMGLIFFFIILLTVLVAYLCYLTGRSLDERRRYTFCIIMSALHCLSFPIGTALGIFTIMVLGRPAVKAAFEANRNS